jgi:putative spermidine/putrescine transport system substrate-binding protein
MTGPTIYNADTLGIRPDLIIVSQQLVQLLNPEFKGKTSISRLSGCGHGDGRGIHGQASYDKGNMTKEEIDTSAWHLY